MLPDSFQFYVSTDAAPVLEIWSYRITKLLHNLCDYLKRNKFQIQQKNHINITNSFKKTNNVMNVRFTLKALSRVGCFMTAN